MVKPTIFVWFVSDTFIFKEQLTGCWLKVQWKFIIMIVFTSVCSLFMSLMVVLCIGTEGRNGWGGVKPCCTQAVLYFEWHFVGWTPCDACRVGSLHFYCLNYRICLFTNTRALITKRKLRAPTEFCPFNYQKQYSHLFNVI